MKLPSGLYNGIRSAGLLAIIMLGLVSIIGTGGGGSNSPSPDERMTFYRDVDMDGYGDPNTSAEFSYRPLGEYVSDNTDCDDENANVHPGVTELCDDGIDNNCDGYIDVGCICTDDDGDGYFAQIGCGTGVDCNDADAAIHPGQAETCWDDVDNNCNGQADEGCTCTDADADGFYAEDDCGTAVDCDDTDAVIYPGGPELCGDGKDNDCDGRDYWCGPGDAIVPDTGQTTCYNNAGRRITCPVPGQAFYGQDASYAINPPSYTKLDGRGDELPDNAAEWVMVRDNVTGLIWEVKTDDNSIHDQYRSYAPSYAADAFIDLVNAEQFGGFSDWRMPTVKELLWLVDSGRYAPAINIDYFPNTVKGSYLAFMDPGDYTGGSGSVDFLSGRGLYFSQPGSFYIRAVRGEKSSSSLTDNGDGTVTDNDTGLMWSQASASNTKTWENALAWCENLVLSDYNDWRLPTIKELVSLVDDDVDGLFIDAGYFPDTTSSYYWSSTTSADYTDGAWAVNFAYGMNIRGNKSVFYNVRAVRGGQVANP